MECFHDYLWLKFLCKLEKVMNISRDFLFLPPRRRFYRSILISIDVLLSILYFINNTNVLNILWRTRPDLRYGSLAIHWANTAINFLCVVYFAPKYGAEFRKVLRIIYKCHKNLERGRAYKDSIFKVNAKCAFMTIFLAILTVHINMSRFRYIIHQNKDASGWIVIIFGSIYRLFIALRFSIEDMVCVTLLTVIHNIFRNINYQTKKINNLTAGNLCKYVRLYQQINEAVKVMETCFSNQVS